MTASEDHAPEELAHGQLCYLQLPARDVGQSAEFYEQIFGWRIERPYPSFQAPGLIGQFVDERAPAAEAGPLLWINVDSIDGTLDRVTEHGGAMLEAPSLDDGVRWLATIRDPAANTIGLVQTGTR